MGFEKPTIEKGPTNQYELEIDEKFWSLVQQRLDLPDVANPEYIKINFSSDHPRVNEEPNTDGEEIDLKNEVLVQGVFDYETKEIHFNVGAGEVAEDDLVEAITHELIHYAQIEGEKYEKMKPPFENDKNLPWEKEAYSLMKPLAKQLLKSFKLETTEN